MSADAGPVALMAAILDHHPGLPGAACRGRGDLFDATERPAGRLGGTRRAQLDQTDAQRRTRALAVCRICPALDACAAWLDGMVPSRRPIGAVMAGRVVTRPHRNAPDTNAIAPLIPGAERTPPALPTDRSYPLARGPAERP
ncbi:hypothetical protein MYK68_18605 [Gordonia sp. PP30]|uniref:hypothetical protein n=1 Tax=Gordonia sp. PP30 TaxID=2935861 RepID=UPI001FFF68E7|nr:hypothetical protein [Gordonia sp. PP30]UQE74696.1 hypothetical protein MYK68_18605 [Gordonia sp. PP30]